MLIKEAQKIDHVINDSMIENMDHWERLKILIWVSLIMIIVHWFLL